MNQLPHTSSCQNRQSLEVAPPSGTTGERSMSREYLKLDTATGEATKLAPDHPFVRESERMEEEAGPAGICPHCNCICHIGKDGNIKAHHIFRDGQHWDCDGAERKPHQNAT